MEHTVTDKIPSSLAHADLLNACHVSIIKGNAGEIGALAGLSEVQSRGVDSVGKGFKDPATVVRTLAARESASRVFSLLYLLLFAPPSTPLPCPSASSPHSAPVLTAKTTTATEVVVAMSGEVDYVSDGTSTFAIENGSDWQGKITGSGCMASS